MTMAIVASPSYLAVRPAVRTPQDLLNHNCITLRLPTLQSLLPWELRQGKRLFQVKVHGQLIFNDVYQIVEAALDGCGLGYVPSDLVEAAVAAGRLNWVLPAWHPTYPGLHVYYPSRRKSSRVVDLVIEALKARPSERSSQ
jgi:DNA-binding transcriptional LysR family regulator